MFCHKGIPFLLAKKMQPEPADKKIGFGSTLKVAAPAPQHWEVLLSALVHFKWQYMAIAGAEPKINNFGYARLQKIKLPIFFNSGK